MPGSSSKNTQQDFSLRGAKVLVTGAGMGMGRLYALRAAREGAAVVVLWDISQQGLDDVAAEVRALGAAAVAQRVDVADLSSVQEAAAAVRASTGTLDLLINNAGIVRGGPFWQHDSRRDTAPIMAVNALAPMYITREFLPDMMADRGRTRRILNIASAAGTLSNPNMSVYAASKWAVIGWSDSLRLELEQAGHRHLKVTTFCPSFVSTGMFKGARGPLLTPIMTPETAVERAWGAMLAGRAQKLTPWTAILGKVLWGVLPTPAWDVVAGRIFKVYSSMDHFTGRPGTPAPAPGGEAPAASPGVKGRP